MRPLLLAVLLAGCASEPAPAPPVEAPAPPAPAAEPAAAGHAHASPHGGILKALGQREVEAVFTPVGLMFYVYDAADAPVPVDGLRGSAVVQGPKGVVTVALSPMGDHLHAPAKLVHGEPATAVLTLVTQGAAESVSFETPTVGLAAHDHTSLHGGQVGMWGDYHLEYAPKDGEHRLWLSDANRVPVTTPTIGSLQDGGTTVPLVFDAATGLLTGKAEGAGIRSVMVDLKVGETSFSLGFNAVEAASAPHDHGQGPHTHGKGEHSHGAGDHGHGKGE